MEKTINLSRVTGWAFGTVVFTIGILNCIFVHPVPGTIFLLLSALYFPPVTRFLKEKAGIAIHPAIKIALGFVIIWFTLGVSDLGDMIDKL